MKYKNGPLDEVKIFIGSQEGYDGPFYDEDVLVAAIGEFQDSLPKGERSPVRVTPTRFVWGSYSEKGWEITCVNYPRDPKGPEAVQMMMEKLAEHLIGRFKQHRISLTIPTRNYIEVISPDHVED